MDRVEILLVGLGKRNRAAWKERFKHPTAFGDYEADVLAVLLTEIVPELQDIAASVASMPEVSTPSEAYPNRVVDDALLLRARKVLSWQPEEGALWTP